MMRVVVIHPVGQSTTVTRLHAPGISAQRHPHGEQVTLRDAEGRQIGYAHFGTDGIVLLGDVAIEQYALPHGDPDARTAHRTPGGPDA